MRNMLNILKKSDAAYNLRRLISPDISNIIKELYFSLEDKIRA